MRAVQPNQPVFTLGDPEIEEFLQRLPNDERKSPERDLMIGRGTTVDDIMSRSWNEEQNRLKQSEDAFLASRTFKSLPKYSAKVSLLESVKISNKRSICKTSTPKNRTKKKVIDAKKAQTFDDVLKSTKTLNQNQTTQEFDQREVTNFRYMTRYKRRMLRQQHQKNPTNLKHTVC